MFKLIFLLGRWKIKSRLPSEIKQCVIVVAPHTSNWDFVYGMGAQQTMKLKPRFAIKKEWLKFPYKKLMISLGALPIDRSKQSTVKEVKSTVEAVADLFHTHKELHLIITPEGTRSRVTKWKTGFYYIALKAKVPIALGFLDYEKRECGVAKVIYPSGDFKRDMKEIMDFYKNIKGKNPETFALDEELSKDQH
jgi:1-acyl-sn-glycerol-3-phosphate acyltransferase